MKRPSCVCQKKKKSQFSKHLPQSLKHVKKKVLSLSALAFSIQARALLTHRLL